MKKKIEIYVRQSAEQNYLTLYVPMELRAAFIAGISEGTFQSKDAEVNLELSVLPEWVTDQKSRTRLAGEESSVHARIPINSINTYFEES